MPTFRRPVIAVAVLAAATLTVPATAALADVVPPHVTLQTGPRDCELQAVLENFPAGTHQLTFRSRAANEPVSFPVMFSGDEGGSDVLVTAGPFGPGPWTARVQGVRNSNRVVVAASCAVPPPTIIAGDTTTTTTGADGQTTTTITAVGATPTTGGPAGGTPVLGGAPAAESALPFTGAGHVWTLAWVGLVAVVAGGYALWRTRTRRA